MKIVITLCLLVAFCTVNANPLDILTDILVSVQKSTKQVHNIIERLEQDRSSVVWRIMLDVEDNFRSQKQRLSDYSNPTIDAIRKEVEAAKAKGKNAQPCYDTASNTLKNISNLASSYAQGQCIDTVESSIKRELGFMDNLTSTGRALILELDSIFLNCYSNDTFEMQRCVALKLVTANIAVENLQDKANSAYQTSTWASNNVKLQSKSCLYNVYSPAILQVTEVRLASAKCLKAYL